MGKTQFSLLTRLLLFYGLFAPNHPRKWWIHGLMRKTLSVAPNQEVQVVRQGLQWFLTPSDYGHHSLFWFGTKNMWDIQQLCRLTPKDGVIIDAGSNFGYYALRIANHLQKQCVVHALEPSPVNNALLRKNRNANGLQEVIHVHGLGLANMLGRANVVDPPGNGGHARLQLNTNGAVAVTTLNDFCQSQNLTRLDWLLLDVEGFEEQALEGGREALLRYKPAILVEIWPPVMTLEQSTPKGVATLLKGLGYRLYVSQRHRLVQLQDLPVGDESLNVFCFHPEGAVQPE